jgi:hypothetical protein
MQLHKRFLPLFSLTRLRLLLLPISLVCLSARVLQRVLPRLLPIPLLVAPLMFAVPALSHAADATDAAPSTLPEAAQPSPATSTSISTTSTPTSSTTSHDDTFGVAMTAEQLDAHRGGDALIGQNDLTGRVANNTANRVDTGSNSISQGSFANASGLPTVIQNSGANVLIQNATVLNVRFGD